MTGVAEDLMNALKYSGIDKQNLSELVQIASGVAKEGIRIVKVFPIGIPYPDGIKIQTELNDQNLSALVRSIGNTARINSVEIFPKGIPAVDSFSADLNIR